MDQWIDFYEPFFQSREAARAFVERCESLTPDDPNHIAKIIMHQAQRLVSIADDLPKIRSQRESLQLVFLLICAEHIGKLHAGFKGEGKSRAYVQDFFHNFLSDDDRYKLETGFSDYNSQLLGLKQVIDLLYQVRCDVVHEGRYWGFTFHDGDTPKLNGEPDVIVNLQFRELRDIIIRGCVKAVESILKKCP